MANQNDLMRSPVPLPLILRETFRHYLEFQGLVMSPTQTSDDRGKINSAVTCDHGVIDYGYNIYDDNDEPFQIARVTLSFWDLHDSLKRLSTRKREAVFYNVILDWKQKDVAARMKISTVSVGQYVQAAMEQLVIALDIQQDLTPFYEQENPRTPTGV